MLRAIMLVALIGLCVAPPLVAGPETELLTVRNLMTEAEQKWCGIPKLSPEERKALDTWLQNYTLKVIETIGTPEAAPSGQVIESHISGEFEGWDGETVFVLDNGQIWQQSSYAYHYHYAYHPKVLIYKSGAGWKMRVHGVNQEISVVRLK